MEALTWILGGTLGMALAIFVIKKLIELLENLVTALLKAVVFGIVIAIIMLGGKLLLGL